MGGACNAHEEPLAFQFLPSSHNSIMNLLNFPGGGGSSITHFSSSQPGQALSSRIDASSLLEAWSQSRGNPSFGGRTASDASGGMSKVEMASRKKKDRAQTTTLWARLELLAPKVNSPAPCSHPVTAGPAHAAQPLGRCTAPAFPFCTLLLADAYPGSTDVNETLTVSIDLLMLAPQPKPLVPEPYTLHPTFYAPAPCTIHPKP